MFNGNGNNIYYVHDSISNTIYGTVITNLGSEISCLNADSIMSFNITHSQPQGTEIFLAFNTGDTWFKLDTSGNAVSISSETPSYATLAEKGNTVTQLKALANIPAFTKKNVRVIVGLSAEDSASSFPRIKFSLNGYNNSQLTTKNEYSPTYELDDDAVITAVTHDGNASNGGAITVKAQATLPDGSQSGWLDLSDIQGMAAKNIQLRATFNSPTIGTSTASLSQAVITYFNSSYSAVEGKGDIITLSQDWYMNISDCRVNIRHSTLERSTMKVYAAFRKSPVLIHSEQLGVGSGSRKTFQLAHTNGIRYDSVKVFYDGTQIFSGWELNSEVGRITCTAQSGVIVSCSYEYGWDAETWQELSLVRQVSLEDYDESEFRLETDSNGCSIGAIKLSMSTTSGSVTSERIGTGTGSAKTYKLKYKASNTPTVYADGSALDRKNYRLLDDPQYIRVAAPASKSITASYKWVSETPKIYQLTAVFSA